jgi:ssDNA-binding Zn-finger/Zn-ribbon topoisomerase 1
MKKSVLEKEVSDKIERLSCPKCRKRFRFKTTFIVVAVLCPKCRKWIEAYENSENHVIIF